MKKIIKIILLVVLIPFFKAEAQSSSDSLIELGIGDTIPKAIWNMPLNVINHPNGKNNITLNEYRGKLIILDFWATWCGPCIAAMPKTDSIQRQYSDQISIITANVSDTKEKIEFFFKHRTNSDGLKYILPTIFGNKNFKNFFKPQTIPHYVWISAKGVIIAVTNPDQLTSENIIEAQRENYHSIKNKIKTEKISPSNQIVQNEENLLRGKSTYRGHLSSEKKSLPTKIGMVGKDEGYTKIFFTNQSLISLIQRSYFGINEIPKNRIFFDDQSLYISKGLGGILSDTTLFCYELVTDTVMPLDSLYAIMRNDLRSYFSISSDTTTKKINTLVLQLSDSSKVINSKGGISDSNILDKTNAFKYILNGKASGLTNLLNTIWETPLVDETNYALNIDLYLPSNLKDISMLKKTLLHQGFKLFSDTRPWVVLEMRKSTSSIKN